MEEYYWYDFVGNVGVFLILFAYFMLQVNRINNKSLTFSLMNGCGAFLILVSLYFDFNLSAFVVEFFWLIISIYGICIKVLKNADKSSGPGTRKRTVS